VPLPHRKRYQDMFQLGPAGKFTNTSGRTPSGCTFRLAPPVAAALAGEGKKPEILWNWSTWSDGS